jgi:predicted GNAT superfamily acetyltransferase
LKIRAGRPEEAAIIHAINESEVPHVGRENEAALASLIAKAFAFRVAETADGHIVGFLLALDQDADYKSLNFKWFQERYPRFMYIDRIAILKEHQKSGLGRALYEDIERLASGYPLLTLEVNVDPPNPSSMAFHERMGYREVGRARNADDGKLVSYQIRHLG